MAEFHPLSESDVTKSSIRQKVWKHMEDNNIAQFPRPVFDRIPNYRGAATACQNITKLDEFKYATSVKVNPDKPQAEIRFLVLEHDKLLYTPTPRLKNGLINYIQVPKAANKQQLRKCASYEGISEYGREIDLDEEVRIDLVITGCVAVSREGWRIGKGEGYADLEVAMMLLLRIVSPEIRIITSVHESQIVDIPESIMQPHDIPVDIIVTPTQVIHCPRRARPSGIMWSLLTAKKLSDIPILNVIREREYYQGADVTLKKEEPDECTGFHVRDRGSDPSCKGKRGSERSLRKSNPNGENKRSDDNVSIRSGGSVESMKCSAGVDVSSFEVISFTDFISQYPDWSLHKK